MKKFIFICVIVFGVYCVQYGLSMTTGDPVELAGRSGGLEAFDSVVINAQRYFYIDRGYALPLSPASITFDMLDGSLSEFSKYYVQTLDLSGCSKLTRLPDLGDLKCLRNLCLVNCIKLQDISTLGNLEQLSELSLARCTCLDDVSSLRELKFLVYLNLSDCTGLTRLPDLRNTCLFLNLIDLTGCSGLPEEVRFQAVGFGPIHEVFEKLEQLGCLY
jgi:hypothetical protein